MSDEEDRTTTPILPLPIWTKGESQNHSGYTEAAALTSALARLWFPTHAPTPKLLLRTGPSIALALPNLTLIPPTVPVQMPSPLQNKRLMNKCASGRMNGKTMPMPDSGCSCAHCFQKARNEITSSPSCGDLLIAPASSIFPRVGRARTPPGLG